MLVCGENQRSFQSLTYLALAPAADQARVAPMVQVLMVLKHKEAADQVVQERPLAY